MYVIYYIRFWILDFEIIPFSKYKGILFLFFTLTIDRFSVHIIKKPINKSKYILGYSHYFQLLITEK